MKYTRRQLYAFIRRAKTLDDIRTASDWLDKHIQNQKLYEDLQLALCMQIMAINAETRRAQSELEIDEYRESA